LIETFLNRLIEELGATGVLVIGLYFILRQPLIKIAAYLKTINEELGEIRDCLIKEIEARHGKT